GMSKDKESGLFQKKTRRIVENSPSVPTYLIVTAINGLVLKHLVIALVMPDGERSSTLPRERRIRRRKAADVRDEDEPPTTDYEVCNYPSILLFASSRLASPRLASVSGSSDDDDDGDGASRKSY
ncbi:hypothetical protein ALC56_09746, partial [Trachymyrmex septentrionalis]